MKNKVRKMLLLLAMVGAMSLGLCACGSEKAAAAPEEEQSSESEASFGSGQSGEKENAPDGQKETADESAGEAQAGTDGIAPEDGTEEASADTEDRPDLQGDVEEIKDGQLTVVEAIQETTDEGAEIMGVPAPGADDSAFDKVVVAYDANTLFTRKTIYDKGARSEVTESAAADLQKGQSIDVWGSLSNGVLKAERICIIKVA